MINHWELLKNHQVENTFQDEVAAFAEESTMEALIEEDVSNDLKEFGVDSEAPDLFSTNNEISGSEELIFSENEEQEDDLEIPAFLRRQKN